MKLCNKCNKMQDESDFYKYRHNTCKSCTKAYRKAWVKANPEKRAKHNRKSYEQVMAAPKTFPSRFRAWKDGAKRRGIIFTLDIKDYSSKPLICHYTGCQLTLERGFPHTLSLDRLDSSKGYTKDNVVFCRYDVNMMKHTFTKAKFLDLCRLVIKNNPE